MEESGNAPRASIAAAVGAVKSQKSMTNFARSFSRLKVRRHTTGFGSVPGIKPVERTSQLGIEYRRPPLVFSNSYRLDPPEIFKRSVILKEIDELLDANFTSHKYNVQESTGLTMRLATDLLRAIKEIGYHRYRIITLVTIGQRRAQSYSNAISFIWDHERDVYVNTSREISSAFIQVTVLGVYLD